MIEVSCNCGSKFKVQDDYAGRHGKCPNCQKTIQVPNAPNQPPRQRDASNNSAATTDRSNKGRCRQCGAPVENLSYSCPFCGGSIQEVSASTAIQASTTDRNVTNTKKTEGWASVVGSFANAFDPLGNLRREASQVPDSPGELVTFFSKHIGGVSEMHYGPIHRQACEAALTKLRIFSANDRKLANVVAELQTQLAERPKAKNPMVILGIIIGISIAGLILILSFMLRQEASTRSDINRLIDQGSYNEARMRAEELSNESQRDSILESIDKAQDRENSRR